MRQTKIVGSTCWNHFPSLPFHDLVLQFLPSSNFPSKNIMIHPLNVRLPDCRRNECLLPETDIYLVGA